jgi:predicted RNase H-like HicB family nuclease
MLFGDSVLYTDSLPWRRLVGTYVAVAPAVPNCIGEGETQGEALNRLKMALEEWLAETEITTIEVTAPETDDGRKFNPWLMTAGIFADDTL